VKYANAHNSNYVTVDKMHQWQINRKMLFNQTITKIYIFLTPPAAMVMNYQKTRCNKINSRRHSTVDTILTCRAWSKALGTSAYPIASYRL